MANTTISVENPNQGSLHVKLSEISNSLADISQTLSLYPAIKKGIEEPDYTNKFKKINSRIKQLINQIEFLNTKVITQEEFDEIYLKIQNFKSKLMSSLDDSIIKNKIKSLFPSLDNYYTKSEVNTIINEHQPNLEDYYTKSQTDNKITSDLNNYYNKQEFNVKLQDYTGDQCGTDETKKIAENYSYNSLKDFVNVFLEEVHPQKLERDPEISPKPDYGYYIETVDNYIISNNEFVSQPPIDNNGDPYPKYQLYVYHVVPGKKYNITVKYYGLESVSTSWKMAAYVQRNENATCNYDIVQLVEDVPQNLREIITRIDYNYVITVPEGQDTLMVMKMTGGNLSNKDTYYAEVYTYDELYGGLVTALINIQNKIFNHNNLNSQFKISKIGEEPFIEFINDHYRFVFKKGGATIQNTFGISSFQIKKNPGSTGIVMDDAGTTDLIGPIDIGGYYRNFIGGNHPCSTTTNTKFNNYYTDSLKIYIDDVLELNLIKNENLDLKAAYTDLYNRITEINATDNNINCKTVKIVITNSIYKPKQEDVAVGSNTKLKDTLTDENYSVNDMIKVCTETQTWTLQDNKATVNVKLYFHTKEDIITYYGMQSYALPKGKKNNNQPDDDANNWNQMILTTTNGKYDIPIYTDQPLLGHDYSFTKGEYPYFNSVTIKHLDSDSQRPNFCEKMELNTNIGLGNHKLIKSSDPIFLKEAGSKKMYHVLIKGSNTVMNDKVIVPAETELQWEGTYSFFIDVDNEITVPESLEPESN